MGQRYVLRTVKNGLESAYAQKGILLRFMWIRDSQALDLNNKARKEKQIDPKSFRKKENKAITKLPLHEIC